MEIPRLKKILPSVEYCSSNQRMNGGDERRRRLPASPPAGLRPGGGGVQPAPASPRATNIGLRAVEKILERRTAGEAISGTVVWIDPVERAIGLDLGAHRDADGVVAVEFSVHRLPGDGSLPYTPGRGGTLRRRHAGPGVRRQHRCGDDGGEESRVGQSWGGTGVHHDASVPFPARYSSAASVPSSRRSLAGGVRAWALAGALAGVCAGCVDYQAAPLDPARRVDQFAARRLTDPALQRELEPLLPQALADWPPHEWDRAQLLAVALVQNPEIAVARAEARAVSAGEITAAQPPNPDLILQSEYAIHDTHPWLYGIAFDWPLRSHERRRLEVDLARLETGRANLRLLDAAWGVRRALIGALSEAQGARRRLLLLTQVGELQDRLVALERRRIAAGEDPATELVNSQRARIEIEQQRAQQLVLANAAQAAAARALGVPPQALDDINLGWPDWGDPPPIDAEALRASRERALLSRADLRGAIGEYAAAETRLHLAVARQYPQFSLGPGYYWDHGIAKFPFDVGFTLPFNGNRGEIAEARAGRELAAQRMLALQADIYGEIAAAERAERLARLNIDAAQRQLQAAQQQSRQAQIGQRVGAIGAAEAAAANLLVLRAQLELLEMRTQLQESRDGLEDVMRTPLSGPELGLAQFAGGVSSGGGT